MQPAVSWANLSFGDGAEVDTAQGAVGQHPTKVPLYLIDRTCAVPVEADTHPFCHALCADARLAIAVVGVEGQAHDPELLSASAIALQGIELVYLVQLHMFTHKKATTQNE